MSTRMKWIWRFLLSLLLQPFSKPSRSCLGQKNIKSVFLKTFFFSFIYSLLRYLKRQKGGKKRKKIIIFAKQAVTSYVSNGATTISIMTFSTMTLNIMSFIKTTNSDTQHNVCYAQCLEKTVMLSVVMLSVVMLNVVMLSVVAPK